MAKFEKNVSHIFWLAVIIVKYNLRDNAADSSWNMEHSQRLLA